MATGKKTGVCWHSALTFYPLPGPQPMGWHHPHSGWIFSVSEFSLEMMIQAEASFCLLDAVIRTVRVSCHSRPIQLVFYHMSTYVLLVTRNG